MCKKLLIGFLVLTLIGCAGMMIEPEKKKAEKMRAAYLAANPDISPRLRKALMDMKHSYIPKPKREPAFGTSTSSKSGEPTKEYWSPGSERRLAYLIENEDLPEDLKICILEGRVKLGMSEEQCIASVGEKKDWEDYIKPLFDLASTPGLDPDIKDFLQNPKMDWGSLSKNGICYDFSGTLSYYFYEYREMQWPDVVHLLSSLKYVVDNPKLPIEVRIKLLKGILWIGMTKEQADVSLRVYMVPLSRFGGKWGIHEQYKYGRWYFYFENEILTSWQEVD